MISVIIYIVVSFLLDGIFSNYVGINLVDPSYFRTIFTIISLVVIYEYFSNKKKYYLILCIFGMLFDIVYTNTFILNIIIFLIISFVIYRLDEYMPSNILTINIKSYTCIAIYHIVSYIILLLANYNSYSLKLLGIILGRSILMSVIYASISYFIMKRLLNYSKIR